MAVLSEDQVKELALAQTDDWITVAREDSTELMLHYYGTGTTEYLTIISGLENAEQLQLRKDHAIPNDFLTENLLRPIDAIWSAKGGAVKIDLPDSVLPKFIEEIQNVGKGYTIREYLKAVWKDKLIADPNGVIFVEVTEKGDTAYLTQKSIFDIKNMKAVGIRPEYIAFEPHLTIEEEENKRKTIKRVLWIVDDEKFYEVQVENEDKTTILNVIDNPFGIVPAIVNSPILDTIRYIKVSPIQKQVKLLGAYLVNNSVKEIYQFLHGYPIFWQYVKKCTKCQGSGQIEGEDCKACSGTGYNLKKDVSDGITLKPPTEADQPVLAPDVAGYVQPDLETWREQRTELDWKYQLIEFSQWGTTSERGEGETATARYIDTQPVNNKLNVYADMAEDVHSYIIDLFGKFYYSESYEGNSVNYGRRFLIESPDQVWKKYLDSKEKKAPISALDQLIEQYYESEYQRNELFLKYYLKLIKVEPFLHDSIEEVIDMKVSAIEQSKKTNFSDWLKTKSINEIIDTDTDKLIIDLEKYSQEKLNKNGTTRTE